MGISARTLLFSVRGIRGSRHNPSTPIPQCICVHSLNEFKNGSTFPMVPPFIPPWSGPLAPQLGSSIWCQGSMRVGLPRGRGMAPLVSLC